MKIAVVVPAYNENKRISKVLEKLVDTNLPIIVVDDGSKDQTFNTVKGFKVIALRHKVNLGKGAALKTGAQAAFSLGAQAVVIMDSDGQHKVEELPKFIQLINSGKYDIVIGTRNLSHGVPLIRYLGNKFASLFIRFLFNIYVSDLLCGYRAFTKQAFNKMNWQSSGYGVETEMIAKIGIYNLKYCEVPVETVYYDKFKGVTILDATNILGNVIKWRLFK